LQVVLEVLPDTGKGVDDRDPERLQERRAPDAGELQELRRVEGAPGEYHLARECMLRRAAALQVLDPDRTRTLEEDPRDERPGADRQVRPIHHGVQVRSRGGE